MKQKKIFIASTGKDVGKTTLSLGVIDFLNKQASPCGFMKPVGQEQLLYQGLYLDKDALLIKQYFKLNPTQELSPLTIPQGFTKDFLDGKITQATLLDTLLKANQTFEHYHSMVYEGTGHLGVGSIIGMSNADVARQLNTPILLVTKGGIGSSFDELILNLSLCEKCKLKVAGVVLNKVTPEKFQSTSGYFEKALKTLGIPFLGALPFELLLAQLTFNDVASVLQVPIHQGSELSFKHIQNTLIIASNNQTPELKAHDLLIVSGSREGLIHALLAQAGHHPIGLILTGDPPSPWILSELEKTLHFVLITQKTSQEVLIELSSFHAKIQAQDSLKIKEAIKLVHKHVDLKKLNELI